MIVSEMYASRETSVGPNGSVRTMWFIGQSSDDATVLEALRVNAPIEFRGLSQKAANITPIGNGWWTGVIDYGIGSGIDRGPGYDPGRPPENPNGGTGGGGNTDPGPGESGGDTSVNDPIPPDVSINAMGRTQHVTQSLYTRDQVKRTNDSRELGNYRQAIGVSGTQVAGTDIIVPSMIWTETWTFMAHYITQAYLKRIDQLTGRVNFRTFRTRPAGSVKFMGYESRAQSGDKRQIVYSFNYEPNTIFRLTEEKDASGNFLWPEVTKEGHDHAWATYETDGTASDSLPMRPREMLVEIVGRPGQWIDTSDGKLYDDGNPDPGSLFIRPTNKADFDLLRIGR